MNLHQILCRAAVTGILVAAAPALAATLPGSAPASSTPREGAAPGEPLIPLPGEQGRDDAAAETEPNAQLPTILTDPAMLPERARKLHAELLQASRSGDLEALRQLIGKGEYATQLSFGEVYEDPIDFLRQSSGDGDGHEILAILSEVLEAGFVRLDAGTAGELFVWPYFHAYPLDRLDAMQRVELFRLITAGDYEDMLAFGGYHFYRVGISPAGEWVFFVAGD